MNLELLESFGQNYPEEFDGSLDCISMAVTCQFNRCGERASVSGSVYAEKGLSNGIERNSFDCVRTNKKMKKHII
jgi:hypothetical protein